MNMSKQKQVKGIVVMNSTLNDFLNGAPVRMDGAQRVMPHFESAGWDVGIVNPQDISLEHNKLRFNKVFTYDTWLSNLREADPEQYKDLDFLWVRQIGENFCDEQFSQNFVNMIDTADQEATYLLNPKGSTKYYLKQVQETLNLPFPVQYHVESMSDLEDIISLGKQVIAKPYVGWKSSNIGILKNKEDLEAFFDDAHRLDNYIFQQFIPLSDDEPHELRISWIGDNHYLREKVYRLDEQGFDEIVKYIIHPPEAITPYQKEILDSAKEQSGMHMGSVDLRNGKYVLELNNAGIGLSIFDHERPDYLQYSLQPKVIEHIRRNI